MADITGGVTVKQTNPSTIDPQYSIEDTSAFQDVRELNVYDFMMHTYNGIGGYRDGTYLIPFARESFYQHRCREAKYHNMFQPIISAMVDPVFEKEIDRKTGSDVINKFFDNVDNAGTNMDNFSNLIISHSRICGITFVVVDNFKDLQNLSKKDAMNQRKYPYCYERLPSAVYKHKIDRFGKLESITFFEETIKIEKKDEQTYRRWDKNETVWYWIKKHGEDDEEIILEQRIHGIGIIPVVVVSPFIKNKKLEKLPDPPLYSLAMLIFSRFNKESKVNELETYQTFSLLVTQGLNVKNLEIGPVNVVNVSDSVTNMPNYISPNHENTRVLVENCERLKEEIYQEAGQKGVYAVKEQQSGIAKDWDFRAEEAVLKESSKGGVQFEKDLIEIVGKYLNTSVSFEPKYPQDFSPQYYDQRVEQILYILKEMPPEDLAIELWAEITEIIFKQTPERAKEIIDSIKESIKNAAELKTAMNGVNDGTDDNFEDKKQG